MINDKLTITLIQSALHWEDIDANLAIFEKKISQTDQKTDLIVLPEMFTTGFTMNVTRLAEPMNGKSLKWMKRQAAQTNAVIVGSIIIKDELQYNPSSQPATTKSGKGRQNYFNRLIWMKPDGSYSTYDKRHLFRMADEHNYYSMGNEKIIMEINGWSICPLICYDLRFPVWSRNINESVNRGSGETVKITNTKSQTRNPVPAYDCLIYIANWPEPRQAAWDILLKARAIENLCYVIGVNRVKKDGNGINYAGGSGIINYKGEPLFYELKNEFVKTITLDKNLLISFREKFPAYLDGDEFEII